MFKKIALFLFAVGVSASYSVGAAGKRMLRRPPSITYVSDITYDAEKN